jgi:hypothetical protein
MVLLLIFLHDYKVAFVVVADFHFKFIRYPRKRFWAVERDMSLVALIVPLAEGFWTEGTVVYRIKTSHHRQVTFV